MNKKIVLFSLIFLIAAGVFIFVEINSTGQSDPFVYITDDYIGSWYFDKDSIEERTDLIEDIQVIDVMMKRIVDKTDNPTGTDVLLWHIDPIRMKYKISDAFAYNQDEELLDAWYLEYEDVSWRHVDVGSTEEIIINAVLEYYNK